MMSDGSSRVGDDAASSLLTRNIMNALPVGIPFTRYFKALAVGRGDLRAAHAYAQGQNWSDSPTVLSTLKAAVAAGSTTDANGSLFYPQTLVNEFVQALRPKTILGRLQGVRPVPANCRYVSASSGVTVHWVGEGFPIAVGEMSLVEQTLAVAKAAGIVCITRELAQSSDPAAEGMIQADLLAALAKFLDAAFIDPAAAAVANTSPASITNGLVPITSSGSSVAAITADLKALFQVLVDAGILLISPALIMRPSTALALAMKRTAADQLAFPEVTVSGGSLFGVPVLVSGNVPGSVSGGSLIVLVDAAEIVSVEGPVVVDSSQEASLQMRTDPLTGAQQMVSLFASNLVGLRVVRYANWRARRPGAVAFIDGANY